MAQVDGKTVKIGDVVFFKSDIEQAGEITKIRRGNWGCEELVLKALSESGFDGDYIGGNETTIVEPRDCWLED